MISSPLRAVAVRGANVEFSNSTLKGSPSSTAPGQTGLFAIASMVRLLGVTIQDYTTGPGIHINGGSADLRNSILHHNERGIRATGAAIAATNTTIGPSANWGNRALGLHQRLRIRLSFERHQRVRQFNRRAEHQLSRNFRAVRM